MGAVEFFAVLTAAGGWAWWNIRHRRPISPWRRSVPSRSRRPAIPQQVRRRVFARDGWRCRWCGSPFDLQVDHMVPKCRGGADRPVNFQTLCGPCNRLKGTALMTRPDVAPWVSGERVQPYVGGRR